jgi:signal peptidase I
MASTPDEQEPKKQQSWWDSYYAMAFLIIAILFCRFYIFEPFKIPSGSMEPTLFGHEDYGDRIVTNKLAYATPKMVGIALAVSVALILFGFFASHGGKTWRSRIAWAAVALASIGGIGFSWASGAVASEPKRFDVVVFQYNTEWASSSPRGPEGEALHVKESNKKINYIKRLVGLPGDKLVVSNGDLFLRKGEDKDGDQIIRKWEVAPETQDILWYPIAKAWMPTMHEKPKKDNPNVDQIHEQFDNLNFPWSGADKDTPGVTRDPNGLSLDGSAPITLNYKYPATNVYLKQGRWPFEHIDCPASKSRDGAAVSDTTLKSRNITAYVSNTWEGVQCPNCGQIQFPLSPKLPPPPPGITSRLVANARGEQVRFFYGGEEIVGDLRIDLSVQLDAPGAMQIQVGSTEHSAVWNIPSKGEGLPAVDTASEKIHTVKKDTPPLSAGSHTLSLAYVDATVIAKLDGQEFDVVKINTTAGPRPQNLQSIARVSFAGVKGRVKKLELWRDLHYTAQIGSMSSRQTSSPQLRWLEDNYNTYVAKIPDKPEKFYLMMGDNSPSSSDGRVWGFVPESELVGRASFVWWPPSRWRFIK